MTGKEEIILFACGSLHHDCLAGKIWLFILFLVISWLFVIMTVIASSSPSLLILYPMDIMLQALVLIPVLYNAIKLIDVKLTDEQSQVVLPTFLVCQYYFAMSMFLLVLLFVGYLSVPHPSGGAATFVNGFVATLGLIGLCLLDFWALFFIVFDAKTMQLLLRGLLTSVTTQTLTKEQYINAYTVIAARQQRTEAVTNSVGALAYFSMVCNDCSTNTYVV